MIGDISEVVQQAWTMVVRGGSATPKFISPNIGIEAHYSIASAPRIADIPFCVDNLPGKAEGFDRQRLYWVPETVLARMRKRSFTRDFLVSSFGYYPRAPGHYVNRPKGIDADILIFVEKGSGWLELHQKRHRIGSGCVFYIPAGVPHRYGAEESDPWGVFWFHFNGKGARGLLDGAELSREQLAIPFALWSALRRQFLAIFSAVERGYHDHTLLEMSQTLINVLVILHRSPFSERESEVRERIERSMQRMRETAHQPLTLSAYAREGGYSVSRFSHWFVRFTGVSPMTYLNEIRIQKASEYLEHSGLSIKEISERLGYVDAHYFARAFKKCAGQSPSQYRVQKVG